MCVNVTTTLPPRGNKTDIFWLLYPNAVKLKLSLLPHAATQVTLSRSDQYAYQINNNFSWVSVVVFDYSLQITPKRSSVKAEPTVRITLTLTRERAIVKIDW